MSSPENRAMTWAVQPLSAADEAWWAAWARLQAEHASAHPLLDVRMVQLLCKHFGSGDLLAASLRCNGEAWMQAILAPDGGGKWSIFAPSQAPLSLVVFRRDLSEPFRHARSLFAKLPGFVLALSCPMQDPLYSPFSGDGQRAHAVTWGTTIRASCQTGFEDYWSSRPRDLRSNLRRYIKRADEEFGNGAWQVTPITALADIGAAVDRYGDLESAGWKSEQGTALSRDNEQGKFYRAVLCDFATRGAATAFELRFRDQLVGARLAVSGPTMHVMLKTTYDEQWKRFAPGRILLYFALKHFFDGAQRVPVEFYTKANPDMLSWSSEQRDIRTATIYRNGLVERLVGLRRRFASSAPAPAAPESQPAEAPQKAS